MTHNILDIVGKTPVLELKNISKIPIFAKAEYLNPSSLVKDRVARAMILHG